MARDYDGANAGSSRVVGRSFEKVWDSFDRLPRVIQHILWTAPFDQDEVEILSILHQGRNAGYDDGAIAIVLTRMIRQDAQMNAGDWGQGYPEIRFTPIVPQRRRQSRSGRKFLR